MQSNVPQSQSSRSPLSGAALHGFLHSFEGAVASFVWENSQWSLWVPELSLTDHPLTPASQVFFPVILRHEQQAFAIRFYYDCATGKVRYYTSAIPEDIARLPEFENAVSELFRHSLAVEPVRPRNLGRRGRRGNGPEQPPKPRKLIGESLAEPAEKAVPTVPVAPVPFSPRPTPAPHPQPVTLTVLPPSPPAPPQAPIVREFAPEPEATPPAPAKHHVRIEIGPHARHVLLAFILTLGAILLASLGVYAWVQSHEDPGVEHHRLQIEEMRLREGR
jgi:hypothetical protein